MLINFPKECPVCKSQFMSLASQINTERCGIVNLFYCMECESFCSPFAPEHLNGPTLNHHKKVFDRNLEFTDKLLNALTLYYSFDKILDIGCGIGSLLYGARTHGINGIGFDVDVEATEYGCRTYGLDLRGEIWTPSSVFLGERTLITCIMVLEHIKWPRPLLHQLILAANAMNSALYISVPWFNRSWWKYLINPVDGDSPINNPWCHVTHFSEKGFEKVCKEMGAKSLVRIVGNPWPGYLINSQCEL